jgi:hypothetical protein
MQIDASISPLDRLIGFVVLFAATMAFLIWLGRCAWRLLFGKLD